MATAKKKPATKATAKATAKPQPDTTSGTPKSASLDVIIEVPNFVYQSRFTKVGQVITLAREGHFILGKMKWADRPDEKLQRPVFRRRATKGTFRQAMQDIAVGKKQGDA